MFSGDLNGKTFEYFKNQAGVTFRQYNDLLKSSTMYTTLEQVKTSLKELQPTVPVAPNIPSPVATAKIPESWTCTSVNLVLYRAVDLTPGKIKNKERFSPRENPKLALPRAIQGLLRDPRGFAEEHVRANKPFVHSAATDESCGGYQGTRAYVYRITIPQMFRFDPPASTTGRSIVSAMPIIWADTMNRSLVGATKVAFDPRKATNEVDLIFDIELNMIDAYKPRGGNWVKIDWNTVKKEL